MSVRRGVLEWMRANDLPDGIPGDAELHVDDLTRADLAALADEPAADLADTLDEWLHRCHGITSGTHNAGLFADLLAARGWRIHRIDPGPPFGELLPASPD